MVKMTIKIIDTKYPRLIISQAMGNGGLSVQSVRILIIALGISTTILITRDIFQEEGKYDQLKKTSIDGRH